jgi:hypothetical protein
MNKNQGPFYRLKQYRKANPQYNPNFTEYERLKTEWLDAHMLEPYTCATYEEAMRECARKAGI